MCPSSKSTLWVPAACGGVLDWERDRNWLLGNEALPPFGLPYTRRDNMGNETRIVAVDQGHEVMPLVAFTSVHAAGFSMGGLAHMPAEYLVELHESWGLEQLLADHEEDIRKSASVGACKSCTVQ